MENTHTPGWLVALLAVFTLSAAAVFSLFLARHAQASALEEEYNQQKAEYSALRPQLQALTDQLGPLEDTILRKRARLTAAEEAELTAENDVNRLVTLNKNVQAELSVAQQESLRTYSERMRELPARRKEVLQEEDRAFQVERQNDERRRALREDVESQSQAIEQQKKRHRAERVSESGRVSDLETRARQLTNQMDLTKAELQSDGLLVAGEAQDGFVVINRGFRDNLRQGSKFTVFTKRGGTLVVKGTIQVERMDERISACRVVEEKDGNDPLIPGDMIHNPVYDPARQRAFAVRGTFSRYSNAELERFITDAGYRLDRELSVNTDYIVIGKGAEDSVTQATRLGVATLTEDQLVDYVRPRSGPDKRTWDFIISEARKGGSFGMVGTFNKARQSLVIEAISSNGGRPTVGLARGMSAVIVGDDALDQMEKARALGVPVISQDQFIDLVK